MARVLFFIFSNNERTMLVDNIGLPTTKTHLLRWFFLNLFLPILFFCLPLALISLLTIKNEYTFTELLHNGTTPLIALMLLIGALNFKPSNSRRHKRQIDSIKIKLLIFGSVVALVSLVLYIAETIANNTTSKYDWILIATSWVMVLLSFYISFTYFIVRKDILSTSRNVRTEHEVGK